MAITMFIALELKASDVRVYKKRKASEYFDVYSGDIRQWNSDISSRFLGHSLAESGLVRRIWDARPSAIDGPVQGIKVFRLSAANSILVAKLRFESGQYDAVSNYRKLSSQYLRGILRPIELDSLIDSDRAVYPVIGTITEANDPWSPLVKDGWAHVHGDFVDAKLLEQIVTRVAIERALLGWAIALPTRRIVRWVQPAVALMRTRQWPVYLMTDRRHISDQYSALRESLNLSAVRAEVIERGKDWWSVIGATSGAMAVVAALIALYR